MDSVSTTSESWPVNEDFMCPLTDEGFSDPLKDPGSVESQVIQPTGNLTVGLSPFQVQTISTPIKLDTKTILIGAFILWSLL